MVVVGGWGVGRRSNGEFGRVTHPCQLFGSSVHPSMVVRRKDQEDTTAVIIAGEGLAVDT